MLGDKSVAHRALILCSWFKGLHTIKNFPKNKDVLTTLNALELHGLTYKFNNKSITIDSSVFSFKETKVNCNNSGTSARLLCGYLSGANVKTTIFGSEGLSNRPMDRVFEPLNNFGAKIESNSGFLPLHIKPSLNFDSFEYDLKIPSAQIKSALIFYAMFMKGRSTLRGSLHTRDHLERLLSYFNYPISIKDNEISIKGSHRICKNLMIELPGDISSASFIVAGALLLEGSNITLKNICFNKYRIGFIEKLIEMGANISVNNKKNIYGDKIADISVSYSPDLTGIEVKEGAVPSMIDEIPMLCVVAAYAQGKSIIHGIDELKIKESNRVKAILNNMNKMGALVEVVSNSLIITPKNRLHNTTINSFDDHRIFMAFYIANLVSKGIFNKNSINSCYKKSFIDFFDILEEIIE